MNLGVSLRQQGVILTGNALQCKAELVMLLHFSPLFTAREPQKIVQKGGRFCKSETICYLLPGTR